MYTLFGFPGFGSVLVEAALELAGLSYQLERVDPFQAGPARERLLAVNPVGHVPALVLPDGRVMTESAAIVLCIAEQVPAAGLAPPPGDPQRGAFLRWLVFLVANVYPTFTYGDDPSRWVEGEASGKQFRQKTDDYRKGLWRQVEASIAPAPWFLGERFSALDIYVCVMTRWRPRRDWFAEQCPKLHGIALACDADPRLAPVWARNFT